MVPENHIAGAFGVIENYFWYAVYGCGLRFYIFEEGNGETAGGSIGK